MTLTVKICGITEPGGFDAALRNGADFVGFVFCPGSRRRIAPEAAGALVKQAGRAVRTVGLFVDADDAAIAATLRVAPLQVLQLHGDETPARVAAIKSLFGLPVIKALPIGNSEDAARATSYEEIADWLLFDTRVGDAPTGGTGRVFDWTLIAGRSFRKPWFLAGGLHAGNLAEAVAISGARAVDVSTGVEDAQGHKDPARVKVFLELARTLPGGA